MFWSRKILDVKFKSSNAFIIIFTVSSSRSENQFNQNKLQSVFLNHDLSEVSDFECFFWQVQATACCSGYFVRLTSNWSDTIFFSFISVVPAIIDRLGDSKQQVNEQCYFFLYLYLFMTVCNYIYNIFSFHGTLSMLFLWFSVIQVLNLEFNLNTAFEQWWMLPYS